jgi:hypothetical protein
LGDDPTGRAKVYRAFFKAHVEGELLSEIRDATNKGPSLRSEYFKDQQRRCTKKIEAGEDRTGEEKSYLNHLENSLYARDG